MEEEHPPRNHNPALNRALRVYLLLLIFASVVEWSFAGYQTLVRHLPNTLSTPLFSSAARYGDWTNFLPRVAHFGEAGMQTRTDLGLPYPYPLPTIFLFVVFLRLFHNPLSAYLVFTTATFTLAAVLFWIFLYRRTRANRTLLFVVWSTLVLGSPALFLLDRGNIEVFLWLFILLGLVCFVRNWKYAAAALFALAACMKIYPALLFLLFVPRRQYRAAALGVVLTAAFSVLALKSVGPTIPQAFHDMSGAAHLLREDQIEGQDEMGLRFDHSLLAVWKHARVVVRGIRHPAPHHPALHFKPAVALYSVLAPLAFVLLYALRLRSLPLLNQFMALTILSVILPYVSYEYTLVQMYLVFAVFLLYLVQDGDLALPRLPHLPAIMACFAIVFAPLAVLALEFFPGQVKTFALVALLGFSLRTPMPSTLFMDRHEQPALADEAYGQPGTLIA